MKNPSSPHASLRFQGLTTEPALQELSSEEHHPTLGYDVELGRFGRPGLAFADTFGVAVSLYFKIGKHLILLLTFAGILQLPALVWYIRRPKEPFPFRVAAGSSGLGGGTLARTSMAAVVSGTYSQELFVMTFVAMASLILFVGGLAGRYFIRRDVSAMRQLMPRPEHYALLFRDVDKTATAAKVLRDCEFFLRGSSIVRVAVHHAGIQRALSKAVETMTLNEAEHRHASCFAWSHIPVFRTFAAQRQRQRLVAADELAELGNRRGPAVAAFVVFETPRAARRAAKEFLVLPSSTALGRGRPMLAPSPADIIWENLEVSKFERYLKRFGVRFGTVLCVLLGLLAALALRSSAIDEANIAVLNGDQQVNATNADDFVEQVQGWYVRSAEPFVTRGPRRRSMLTVLTVVILNFCLRFVVRRGSVFEAHSTRTTEQSAALASYFASTTLNTFACYAVAAWRSAARFRQGKVQVWYAEVGGYLIMNLLWEAVAPIAGAVFRAIARRFLGLSLIDQQDRLTAARSSASRGRRRRHRRFDEKTPLVIPRRDVDVPRENFLTETRNRLSCYVVAPPWDPVARSADCLRVFTIGAVFGTGFPLMPWLAAGCLSVMLAHDKWALLKERRPPPLLGPHLARTAATLTPFAAPAHALLAIWTWTDLGRPLVCPQGWTACALNTVTWPLALEVVAFVIATAAAWGRRPSTSQQRETSVDDDDDDDSDLVTVYDDDDSEAGDAAPDGPTWREARLSFQRKGIPYLYDVYDDARPLERERHPDFFRRWSVLESNDVAQSVLQLFTPPRGVSDACDAAGGGGPSLQLVEPSRNSG